MLDGLSCTIAASWVVFAITLTVNKSTLFAKKREFVRKRYESSFVGEMRPGAIHRFWYAWWTCPMCFGFWVSLFIVPFATSNLFSHFGYFFDVLMVYGLNWFWHCLENYLFTFSGSNHLNSRQENKNKSPENNNTIK